MKRFMLGTLFAALFGVISPAFVPAASAQTKEETATSEAAPRRSGATNAAVQLLRKNVETIDWVDKPFEEVLQWLKDQGENRVNIVPRWNPLGVESVARETYVNLQLNNTVVGDVLNETITQLSEDGEIRFRASGNTLTISTKADLERQMYVRIYDATDLLMRVPDFGRSAPQIDLQQAGQQSRGGSGGGGSGQSVFGGAGGGQTNEDEEGGQQGEQELLRRLGELRNIILRSVYPESWEDTVVQTGQGPQFNTPAGGGKGRISIYNRALIVYNTIEVHEAIAGYFNYDE